MLRVQTPKRLQVEITSSFAQVFCDLLSKTATKDIVFVNIKAFHAFLTGQTSLTLRTGRDGRPVVELVLWSLPLDSRRQNLLLPSCPAGNICPYPPVPSSPSIIPVKTT